MYIVPTKLTVAPLSYAPFSQLKGSSRKPSVFFSEVQPLLFFWRLLGRFPFTWDGRNVQIKLCGFWTFYTVIVLLLTVSIQFWALKEEFSRSTLRDNLISGIVFIIFAIGTVSPLLVWLEAPAILRFFRKWNEFEDELGELGLLQTKKLRKSCKMAAMLTVPLALGFALLDSFIFHGSLSLPFKFLTYCNTISTIVMWIAFCLFLKDTASFLLRHTNLVLRDRTGSRQDLSSLRRTWKVLADLYAALGSALGPTILLLVVIYTVTCITTLYAMIYISQGGFRLQTKSFFLAVLIVFLVSFCMISYLCEMAQRCSDKAGSDFIEVILEQNFAKIDREKELELTLFLKTANQRYPHIKLGGYVTINRSLFISLLSASATYLIVLVQFRNGEEVNAAIERESQP